MSLKDRLGSVKLRPTIGVVFNQLGGSKEKDRYSGWGIPGTSIGVGIYIGISATRKRGLTPMVGLGLLIGSTGIYLANNVGGGAINDEGNGVGLGIIYPFYRIIGFETAVASAIASSYQPEGLDPYAKLILNISLYSIILASMVYNFYKFPDLRNYVKNKIKNSRRGLLDKLKKSIKTLDSLLG